MKKILMFLTAILLLQEVQAQQFTTLLNPNTSANFAPFQSDDIRRLRTIYRPSDFLVTPASGLITTIYMAGASGSGGGTWSNFTVSIGQTTDTVFNSGAFSPALTTCLQAPSFSILNAPLNGFFAIPLTTPFPFDSTLSLIVEISFDDRTAGTGFAVRGNTLTGLNVGISGATRTSATGTLGAVQRTLGIDLAALPALDAGLVSLSNPAPPFVPGGSTPVVANFTNFGSTTITSITASYQIGNATPTTETFTVNTPTFQTGVLSFTNLATLTTTDDVLRVWISAVNGAADANAGNDTLRREICLPLAAGNYTLGGTTADFANFSALIDRLNCSGISGNVAILVNSGNYIGSFQFGNIVGAGQGIGLSIGAASGNPADVRLFSNGPNNPIFSFSGTQGVNLVDMTLVRNAAVTAATPLIQLTGTVGMAVNNVTFVDSVRTVNANNMAIWVDGGSTAVISNSRFTGFGEPVRLTGSTAQFANFHQITGNSFTAYLLNGIHATLQQNVNISNNRIRNFEGATNTGAGILLTNSMISRVEANRIGGGLARSAMELNNLNIGVAGELNQIVNNEITGSTNTSNGATGITRGIWLTGSTANGRDGVALLHNTISYTPLGNNTALNQGLLVVDGATGTTQPFDVLNIWNNNLVEPVLTGQHPNTFAVASFSNRAVVDSASIGFNNYFKPLENIQGTLMRIQSPARTFATYVAWRDTIVNDSASLSVNPFFVADTLLIPFSVGMDNAGTPLAGVSTDLTGSPRSTTSPDIGAYEFVGQSLSQFVFTPLTNTTDTTNRSLTVVINDSTGLVISGPNSPRMYYKKVNQPFFQIDSVPAVTGNAYTFTFSSAALGGVNQGDTIQYYLAAQNNGGTVTTVPLGGSGSNPVGSIAPTSLLSYEIVRSAQGTYTVGQQGDFATITAAANFINNANFTGTATFVLIDANYATNETFPIVFTNNSTRNDSVRAIIRPDSGVVATIQGAMSASVPQLILFNNANDIHLAGNWQGDTTSRLTITTSSTVASTALVHLNGAANAGTDRISISYIRFLGANAEVNPQFGISAGGQTISVTSEGEHRLLHFHHNRFERLFQGIYVRGTSARPALGTNISHNHFGNVDSTFKIGVRGIWLQNTDSTQVVNNVFRSIASPINQPKTGIQTALVNTRLQIVRNDIRGIFHTQFTGVAQGAYGIFINGGNAVLIANNVITDIRVGNTGNASFDVATGIRLSAGTGHRLYYNTVHMTGIYTQPATGGAFTTALSVTATGVNSLDVRNNIFSNNMRSVSTSTGVYFTAVAFAQNYNFSTSTFDHNAYAVGDTSQTLLARFSTLLSQVFINDLPGFRALTQAGNPANDVNSLPPVGKVPAPFVSNQILTIDTTIATLYESAGVEIAALGLPNTDFTGLARPAFGGTAPDLGAFEFNGLLAGDELAPELSNVVLTPGFAECSPVARTMRLNLEDETGIETATLWYRVNQGALQSTNMTLDTGTVQNGRWLATVPAATAGAGVHLFLIATDSVGNSTDTLRLGTFRDASLQVTAQADTTMQGGAPFIRTATGNAGGLRLSEVFYNRLLTGAQSAYPSGFPTASSQVAIEISNTSRTAINLAGKQLRVEGFFNINFNLPAISLDSGQVVTIVAGSTTSQAAARIYGWGTAGGTSPFNSSNVVGIWIEEQATREVIDAVSINGHVFSQGSGVNAFDFSGTVNAANRASIQRTGTAARNIFAWRTSEAGSESTIGDFNPDLQLDPGTYSWRSLASGAVLDTNRRANFVPTGTGLYTLSYSADGCTVTDTFEITLTSPDLAIVRFISPQPNDLVRDPVAVRVLLRNVGLATINGPASFRYRINNTLPTNPVTVMLNLAPGDSAEVSITPDWIPGPGGAYSLCALVDALADDPNRANDTLCISINSTVSVNDPALNAARMYPNPTNELFTIADAPAGTLLVVRDVRGQLVWQGEIPETGSITIPVNSWAAGMYNVQLQSSQGVNNRRLVVVR